jgi:hypothetical protein
VLDGAEVATRRSCPDGGALHEDDLRPPIGEDGGCGAADDPSTDDDDLAPHGREDTGVASGVLSSRLVAVRRRSNRTPIDDASGLDAELVGWLREAYERA